MKKQISEEVKNELLVTKSKFIAYIFPVNNLEETKNYLLRFKEEYKDSTHICYSYILDENSFKYYDDGEPSCTAGLPIYSVLKNNNLVYTMCVVIRYFGGTKLGVGGLIKAYTSSCQECLKKAMTRIYHKEKEYLINTSYSIYEKLEYYLKTNKINIKRKSFNQNVELIIDLDEKSLLKLHESFINSITIKELK